MFDSAHTPHNHLFVRGPGLGLALGLALLVVPACNGDDKDGEGECPSDQEFFEKHVQGPVLAMRCSETSTSGEGRAPRSPLLSAPVSGPVSAVSPRCGRTTLDRSSR